jgi:hypothetical protein
MTISLQARVSALRLAMPKLGESDQKFAGSLCDQFDRRGLSPKQEPWIDRLLDRANNPPADIKLGSNLSGIIAMLDKAKAQGKKSPALLVAAGDRELRLNIAGNRAKVPGSINVVDAKSDANEWYGRVTRDGVFQPSRRYDSATVTAVGAALQAMADDPAAAAGAYGKLTMRCCFCGLPLGRGKDRRSVEVGYGPDCAARFGVPWGVKP